MTKPVNPTSARGAPIVCARGRHQRGAALLMAMAIVTLVTTIAASMVWQQWHAVQVESAERSAVQSRLILRGGLEWGRLFLREDALDTKKGAIDDLSDIWATPLADIPISSFLAVDKDNTDDAPAGFLSGQISDVSARYNLLGLYDVATDDIDPKQLAVLQRLCEFAALSPAVADVIAQGLRKAILATKADDPVALAKLGGAAARLAAPLWPQTVDQLVWLGLDAASVERLRPFVTLVVVPGQGGGTPININTASKQVIAAVLEGVDLSRADRLVQMRQRNYFKNTQEVEQALGNQLIAAGSIDVKSNHFEIQGRLRLEDRVLTQRYLVERGAGNDATVTVLLETPLSADELAAQPGGTR